MHAFDGSAVTPVCVIASGHWSPANWFKHQADLTAISLSRIMIRPYIRLSVQKRPVRAASQIRRLSPMAVEACNGELRRAHSVSREDT
jgi:hypothetical protein